MEEEEEDESELAAKRVQTPTYVCYDLLNEKLKKMKTMIANLVSAAENKVTEGRCCYGCGDVGHKARLFKITFT
jgi:hypothetical protein